MSRLLFVDDDTELLEICRRTAERHGFTVLTAGDGAEGLSLAERNHPDLVVLDVSMPKMDGRDVCRRLKETEGTRDIPVLFLSGRGDPFSRQLGLELGAEDFIEKPFDLDGLMRKVKYILGKRRNE